MGVCDFCHDSNPVWNFPARTFADAVTRMNPTLPAYVSVGAWGACELCAALIRAGDWDALADRGMQCPGAQVIARDFGRAIALDTIRKIQQEFRTHRIEGDAVRAGKGGE